MSFMNLVSYEFRGLINKARVIATPKTQKTQVADKFASYRGRLKWWQVAFFWLNFAFETLISRRLSRLVYWRLAGLPLKVQRLENLPTTGTFILALNHFNGRYSLDVIAAVLSAANQARPDLADSYILVTGQRKRRKTGQPPLPARIVRRVINWVFVRWQNQTVRIALGNERVSIKALRHWRTQIRQQPALVFPEGRARIEFGTIRQGAGRWLAGQGVPVVPVGVWWHNEAWHVHFGKPLLWSNRPELYDLQLGLNIALLLPSDLTLQWQARLAQWRALHQKG